MAREEKETKTQFEVDGPFRIPAQRVKGGIKIIGKDDAKAFWTSSSRIQELAGCVGCYVFAMQAGKGFKPAYVGKTVRSFEREAICRSKRGMYNEYMSRHYAKGTPIMFLLSYPSKSKVSKKRIKQLETFLIQTAVVRNDKLINVQGTRTPRWGIAGVIRSRRRATKDAKEFKRLLRFK